MRFGLTDAQKSWREEVREFIRTSADPALFDHWSTSYESSGLSDGMAWRHALGERGWLTPGLPKEFGGQGMGYVDQWILLDEVCKAGLPKVGIAASMIAPTLLRVASEEMKQEWLPRIAAGESEFALGYSEPEAGTDLANLRTTAVLDGDEFVINGSKIWNSGAHVASHEWLAVRTDPSASKHRGISIILVPMDSSGITVRPIWTWGEHRTNEVFFDNVRVPASSLVGELNSGWKYITHALGSERLILGETGDVVRLLAMLIAHLNTTVRKGRLLASDPIVRDQIARLETELHASRLLSLRAAIALDEGHETTYEASALKVWITELRTRLSDIATVQLGMHGQLTHGDPIAPVRGLIEIGVRDAIRLGFTGGANEVQRDMIATRGLGLPRASQVLTDRQLDESIPSGIHKLGLDDIQTDLIEIARKFRRSSLSSTAIREIAGSASGHPDQLWKEAAKLGWLGLSVPEEAGGSGASFTDLAVLTEELGRGLMPNTFQVTNALAYLLLEVAPDSELAAGLLRELCAGEILVSLALAEPDETEDVAGFRTQARFEDRDWRLDGEKAFVAEAVSAGKIVVVARLIDPFEAAAATAGIFVVDADSAGVTLHAMSPTGGDRQSRVTLSNVRVASEALLCSGAAAQRALSSCRDHWIGLQLADEIGVGHEVLEMTVRHLKRRIAFGVALGSFQAPRHKCADMLVRLDCARELAYEAILRVSEGQPAALELSRAKSFVTETIKSIAYTAHQLHGGIGYTLEHDLHLYTNRARGAELRLGTPFEHRAALASLIGLRSSTGF